ncbi:MAG: alpha/beta fold hydrolase, partial [Roseibium sp.]|uniref:thioesterase domain-containing protein n=1 Tax=Roseibium sp. TaxID=1936156 RepID=UPI002622B1F1
PANKHMYPGETLAEAAGHQVLYAFEPGEAGKPLIVFVPGDAHLARIFYGYPGGKSEDFVAHWVKQAGYSFLAVSYPLANPVFSEVVPAYTIKDWGNQVAAVIASVTKKNQLSGPVIVAGWSMGGKIAASVGRAAKANGTDIAMFVAMSADPPVPGFLPPANVKSIKLDENGYADRTPIYDWFLNAVTEQNTYNAHTIIPKNTYVEEFLGAVPIDLIDTGLVYENGELVSDIAKAIETSGAFSFSDYPFPVLVHDNSTSDFENVLLDASDWSFVRNRVLVERFMGERKPTDLSAGEWQQLQLLVSASQQFFTEVVEGNHFFFIGEIGARKAMEKILTLHARVDSLPKAAGN